MHRAIPVEVTPDGLRATSGNKAINPKNVQRYLEGKFGDSLPAATSAMRVLAKSKPPRELAKSAYDLYEKFRPAIPPGVRGWGSAGDLSLDLVRSLA